MSGDTATVLYKVRFVWPRRLGGDENLKLQLCAAQTLHPRRAGKYCSPTCQLGMVHMETMQECLQSDSVGSQIIIVNNARYVGADQGSNMIAQHAGDGSVRGASTRQNTSVGNRINGRSRGPCGGNIDQMKHCITGSSPAKPGGLMPPGQKRSLSPVCEAEQGARRLCDTAR